MTEGQFVSTRMGGDIDVNERLREQCSVGGEEDVLKHLRDGAAVNSQNRVNGWCALHFAVRREHAGIVRVLLEHGADTGIRNHKGELAIDMTSNKEIRRIIEGTRVTIADNQKGENTQGAKANNVEPCPSNEGSSQPSAVGFLSGYLANPVFPYQFAPPKISSEQSDTSSSHESKDQHVLLPGYLANPIYAVAAGSQILATGNAPSSEALHNDGTVNFVPGYIANPVIPYAVATASQANESNEIKNIFVPHVEQFGSLVNTYVTSFKSLEKPVEYHMCDSCKTTPVATVYAGSNISEIVIKIRKANTNDLDFIEVELNRKVLTYDELINVCSKELKVDRDSISKIRKLPDTVIRRDKDVQRFTPFQELEVVLLNS